MTEDEFLALLEQPEGETLDFKRQLADFSKPQGKGEFIRDVLAMANTPRTESSYIILGVDDEDSQGRRTLKGISAHFDEVTLQAQLRDRVYPIPVVRYSVVAYDNKSFGIIEIPPERRGPCMPVRTFADLKLLNGQVLLRRGSQNDVAKPADLNRIHDWLNGRPPQSAEPVIDNPEWVEFAESVHYFEPTRRYLLIAHPFSSDLAAQLSTLGKVPWSAVMDFDQAGDTKGLLAAVRPTLESHRSSRIGVLGSKCPANFDSATYWYFARGLDGRDDTIEIGKWQHWVRRYQIELTRQFERIASSTAPSPVTCVVLWHDSSLANHTDSVLQAAYGAFGDALHTTIITGNHDDASRLVDKFDARQFDITWAGLARGIDGTRSLRTVTPGKCIIPGIHGEPVEVEPGKMGWLKEELDVVDLASGQTLPDQEEPRRDFLRGSEIGWFALGAHCDVDRDKTRRLKAKIEGELRNRRTSRVNLYHAPGGGGTTVAKRVLWDFHDKYPAIILHRTSPAESADRLYTLTSMTAQPLLVMIDGSEIAERDVDDLYQILSSRRIPVVILQVLRRFQPQKEGPRAAYFPAELTIGESARFAEQYASAAPESRHRLEALVNASDPRTRTAFYFGLATFGKEFLGLTPYVEQRLQELTQTQRRIVAHLALSHHYAQRPLPVQMFTDVLGIPARSAIDLTKVLPQATLELLIDVGSGRWRTAHDLIAEEVLTQLLTPGDEERLNWRQQLSAWSIEFAHTCRGRDNIPSDELTEIARRAFIYRDNSNLLGTERSGERRFSQLIDDIPTRIGRENVLKNLADTFPDEAHFQAHLARFYSLQVGDFEQAKLYIDKAIAIQDTDPLLHHVRGMVVRSQAYRAMEEDAEISSVVKLAEAASESFQQSRAISPDNEHAYISEAQMLIRLLDYCGSMHPQGVLGYLSQPVVDPLLRDAVERTEDLLDHVQGAREGVGQSSYEQDCRGGLSDLLSDHETALQTWNSLLDPNRGAYRPPIRRQLVWTYLRRRGSWDTLPAKEVARIVDLLQENLSEEPNKDSNLRLWVRAVRRLESPPSPQQVIEKLAYWKANTNSLEASYYLYVFFCLLVIQGHRAYRTDAERALEECKRLSQNRQKRTKSYEWWGSGGGIDRLVHHSLLGEWDREKEFWERNSPLERVPGVIVDAGSPQKGTIEVPGGIKAFFVPARGDFHAGKSENQRVTLYLGFSYEGLRAWEVRNAV